MALLKTCCCYSLRQGSFIIGTYSLIMYCVGFAVELWWITLGMLPVPAYALCALYFFNFVTAAILLFGLLVRQRKYLMTWMLTTALSFFPEAGMALFMSLYYWPTQKYEYAAVELVAWALRAIFNIFGALCVCSLYLTWRDEALILENLKDLSLAHFEKGHRHHHGILGYQSTLQQRHNTQNECNSRRMNQRSLSTGHYLHYSGQGNAQGYQNFGYNWNSSCDGKSYFLTLRPRPEAPPSRASQSFTSHVNNCLPPHQPSQQRRGDGFYENGRKGNQLQLNPALIFDPTLRKSKISEWGIAGVGIEPPGYPGTFLQRSKSDWNVSNDDYWARAPPSRPVSMGYVNRSVALAENSYEANGSSSNSNCTRMATSVVDSGKRFAVRMGGRRAASMDGLQHFHRYNNPTTRKTNYMPQWSNSSLESGNDEDYDESDEKACTRAPMDLLARY